MCVYVRLENLPQLFTTYRQRGRERVTVGTQWEHRICENTGGNESLWEHSGNTGFVGTQAGTSRWEHSGNTGFSGNAQPFDPGTTGIWEHRRERVKWEHRRERVNENTGGNESMRTQWDHRISREHSGNTGFVGTPAGTSKGGNTGGNTGFVGTQWERVDPGTQDGNESMRTQREHRIGGNTGAGWEHRRERVD
jgi:hypothetical protein